MNWLLKRKTDINNIEQVGANKYSLSLSQRPKDDNTQYLEVIIKGAPTTARVKEELIKLQNEYDLSEEVNSFTINGITGWIDRNTRIALKNSISVMESREQSTYTVWLGGIEMTLPIVVIRNFLDALEVYAIEAFNVTQTHLSEIKNISERDELFTYDISKGYPEKINITIDL